jgi:hypothetical protein
LSLKTIYRDLFLLLRGSYATFGRGTLFQKYAGLSFTSEQPQFQFNTDGWAADGSGSFGLAVNLTTGRTYKVLIIPLFGFSGHFEYLHRNDPSPNPYESPGAFTMQSSLPGKLHLMWYGFFLGGNVSIEPGGPLILQAGYAYHWLHLNFKSRFQSQVVQNNTSQTTESSLRVKEGGNLGHTGWLQLDFILPKLWRLGVGAQIRYFSSHVISVKEKQQMATLDRKYKLRWTPISGWLQVSREF